MARLRILAAMALAGSMLLVGGSTVAAAPHAPANQILPAFGLPFFDFAFPCTADLLGRNDVGTTDGGGEIETTLSFVVITTQQLPDVGPTSGVPSLPGIDLPNLPGFLDLPGLGFDGASLDLMKCYFTYPAGTVPNAPFTETDFFCDYYNSQTGEHVFAQSMLIVRETWALMSCLGTQQITGVTGTPPTNVTRIGRGTR